MDDKLIDKIRSFRIQNKFKKHDARNEKYQELYDKHESIKEETVAKIDSGEITDDSQLKGVNRQLQRLRDRMVESKREISSLLKRFRRSWTREPTATKTSLKLIEHEVI